MGNIDNSILNEKKYTVGQFFLFEGVVSSKTLSNRFALEFLCTLGYSACLTGYYTTFFPIVDFLL